MSVPHLLSVEQVSRSFDGVVALNAVSLGFPEIGLFGVIGPNGSGKTTLFNVLTGLFPPDSGRIRLRGTDLTGLPPHRVAALGIARTFQSPRVYERLTIRENLTAPCAPLPGRAMRKAARGRIDPLLEAVGLSARADHMPDSLTLAELRRLEVARALVADPAVLLLDEPAGGMTPSETAGMTALVRDVAAPGRCCIVIEHKMDMIFSLCERVSVLQNGALIAVGTPAEIRADPAVREAYLGRRHRFREEAGAC
jgi:branched-chain amino acid transport system ATP-binding protein